jgi:hypothetical protein
MHTLLYFEGPNNLNWTNHSVVHGNVTQSAAQNDLITNKGLPQSVQQNNVLR